MGYRILILDTYYRTFLGSLYRQQPHLADRPYADQLQVLLDACFGTADAYSSNLNAQGHKAAEVVVNAPLLQRRWACEHGLRIASRPPTVAIRRYRGLPVPRIKRDERWLYSVLIAQVKDYRPDVLYVQDIRWLPRQVLEQARADVRWVVGQHATTFLVPEQCRGYDLIVSSLPNQVAYFRRLGIPSEYLAIGFYAKVLSRLQPQSLETDVVHVGGYGRIHAERNELLSRVAREVPVDFWGYGVRNLPLRSPIRKRYRGEAWGLDMYQVRRNSRVVLTKHITAVAGNYANNCTLFETTGIGSCLLADHKDNIRDLFEPDKEVVTYTSAQDCAEKLRYLLDHDDERAAVAEAGQARTLSQHTYEHRMQELGSILERHLR